jgi:hypothetical protein
MDKGMVFAQSIGSVVGFTLGNMLLSAGITVGFKLVEQVRNGEKISIGKAVGHLASGEFVGGYAGAGLGAAAGSVIGSLLGGTIPIVGPVIGALAPAVFAHVGGTIGAQLGNGLATGQRPKLGQIISSMDKGMVFAQSIGSVVGFTLGNMLLPGIGGFAGGIIGSMVGSKLLNMIRGRKDKLSVSAVSVAGGGAVISASKGVRSSGLVRGRVNIMDKIRTKSVGSGNSAYNRLIAAYKRYSQYLSNGKGNTPEGIKALKDYKEALSNYNRSK